MIRKAAHARMQRSASSAHFGRRLLAPGVVLAALLAPEPPSVATETPADVALAVDVMIPMRDGARLAADVYRPARDGVPIEGRFPALLMRTPYNKEVRAAPFARYFASRGYVVVVQDVRGRYRSQGRWRPLSDDGRDGYDTTQWIGQQSWSDGGIGTVGTSYEGGTQHALAIAAAPFVKAMIPLFSMSDEWRSEIGRAHV